MTLFELSESTEISYTIEKKVQCVICMKYDKEFVLSSAITMIFRFACSWTATHFNGNCVDIVLLVRLVRTFPHIANWYLWLNDGSEWKKIQRIRCGIMSLYLASFARTYISVSGVLKFNYFQTLRIIDFTSNKLCSVRMLFETCYDAHILNENNDESKEQCTQSHGKISWRGSIVIQYTRTVQLLLIFAIII